MASLKPATNPPPKRPAATMAVADDDLDPFEPFRDDEPEVDAEYAAYLDREEQIANGFIPEDDGDDEPDTCDDDE
jgi:hypothetical protein